MPCKLCDENNIVVWGNSIILTPRRQNVLKTWTREKHTYSANWVQCV